MSWLSNLAHKLPSPVDPLHIFGKHNPTDPLNIFGKTGLPNPADPFNTFKGSSITPITPTTPAAPGAPGASDSAGGLAGGTLGAPPVDPTAASGQVTPPLTAPAPTSPTAMAEGALAAPAAPPSATGAPAAIMSPHIQSFLNRIMHGGLSGFGAFGGLPFGGFGQFLMSNPELMRELGMTPQGAVPEPLPGAAPAVPAGTLPPMLRTG